LETKEDNWTAGQSKMHIKHAHHLRSTPGRTALHHNLQRFGNQRLKCGPFLRRYVGHFARAIYENAGVFVLGVEQQSKTYAAASHAFPGLNKKHVVASGREGGSCDIAEKDDGMCCGSAIYSCGAQQFTAAISRVLLNMIGASG
jgi:hypothetical protein